MDGKDGPNVCRFNFEWHVSNLLNHTRKERMNKLIALLIFIPTVANAQTVTPAFTQGSMQATTTTTTNIDRTIVTEVYGGDYSSWSGTNVTPSADYSSFTVIDNSLPFQYEAVTRIAGLVEETTIDETITQVTSTTSLSMFSQ